MFIGYLSPVSAIGSLGSLAQRQRRRNLDVLRTGPSVGQVGIFRDVYLSFFARSREGFKVVVFFYIIESARNLRSGNPAARVQRGYAVRRADFTFVNRRIS